ncbi:hypothetical protein V6N13_014209 [Hibiscus sabdariffa]|uniref:Bifunctional inhibitor/plant lipid transfer protein/seed storage helical domain-containing protein n=1 Tax=Hibiscus sabdariffa TaxID=183260 RepID=A0ABR2RVD1_9ROSI
MCASLKFLAMLVFLIASGITQVSVVTANRNLPGLRGPDPNDSYIAPFLWTDVRGAISECRPFFISMDPDPEPSCCAGAKSIAQLIKTKRDEQELCLCLQLILPLHGEYDPKRLPLLSQKCHINFSFPPVTSDTKC